MNHIDAPQRLSTAAVARLAGVHKDTLLRWLRAGLVREPHRDRHGWRYFTPAEAQAVVDFAQVSTEAMQPLALVAGEPRTPYLGKLAAIDWDFADAKTSYLTHGIHPYPAKFIPQIPNALIQELSSVGDTVADIFCGSGTTLVEALTLKRHAVGIDANPLACLISKSKTTVISETEASDLLALAQRARTLGDSLLPTGEGDLFPAPRFISTAWRPTFDKLDFWFEPPVIEELAEALAWCRRVASEPARNLALTAFSAIVVAVSKQDSDTRYVRRDKNIPTGETLRRFARSLEQVTRAAVEFSQLVEPRFRCEVIAANLLDLPEIPQAGSGGLLSAVSECLQLSSLSHDAHGLARHGPAEVQTRRDRQPSQVQQQRQERRHRRNLQGGVRQNPALACRLTETRWLRLFRGG